MWDYSEVNFSPTSSQWLYMQGDHKARFHCLVIPGDKDYCWCRSNCPDQLSPGHCHLAWCVMSGQWSPGQWLHSAAPCPVLTSDQWLERGLWQQAAVLVSASTGVYRLWHLLQGNTFGTTPILSHQQHFRAQDLLHFNWILTGVKQDSDGCLVDGCLVDTLTQW